MMINDLLVLGSGSAGLLAALSVKRKMPRVKVRIVRSPDIGTIAVGESTTPNVRAFIFEYLGIDRRAFFQMAEPTWKLGIHFLWGPRASYEYPFVPQLDARLTDLPRPMGYYCDDDFAAISVHTALMAEGKAFARRSDGIPDMDNAYAFHLENAKFVKTLEFAAQRTGIEFIDGTISGAEKGPGESPPWCWKTGDGSRRISTSTPADSAANWWGNSCRNRLSVSKNRCLTTGQSLAPGIARTSRFCRTQLQRQ
jgi:tryptophan halogenase